MANYRSHAIRAACAASLFLAGTPAFAHHPTGGQTPMTFGDGLLSGLGHPVIGIDHFAFVVAVGIAAALAGRLWPLAVSFVVGAVGGCLVHVAGINLPVAELVIAATVLLLGAIIATNRQLPAIMLGTLFAGAGLFHGWAYGGSILGAQEMPLVAYLTGFTLIQLAIALFAGLVTRWVMVSHPARQMNVRLAGGVVAGMGLALFVGQIEGVLFPGVL
ncbi:HupE/UreJ family protein [Sphingomonas sp.]|uniref:HupE/UreJ family protein n=1 Tax=Sphingomonas sp. TaxID=28214 RepID=UPI00263332CF|nr:HupE/UreJ family protein [Sphingomonas sp.]